jgi:hypothetical protein
VSAGIPFRVGLNNDRLELFPHADYVECYREVRIAVGPSLVFAPRVMHFSEVDHGNKLTILSSSRSVSDPDQYGYPFEGLDLRGLAEFGRHEVELECDGPHQLQWKVPPNHLLPWLDGNKVSRKNLRGSAVRGMSLRISSALEAGMDMRQFVADTPRWVKGQFTAHEWREWVIDRINGRRAA